MSNGMLFHISTPVKISYPLINYIAPEESHKFYLLLILNLRLCYLDLHLEQCMQ